MPKNSLADLRDHLFETIESLKDKEDPMDLERARTIAHIAQTAINMAKVEVDAVRAADGRAVAGAFFNVAEESRELPPAHPRQITGPAREPLEKFAQRVHVRAGER